MELRPQRIRNRLSEHDYHLDGIYFITCCTQNKEPILWVQPNPVGDRISQPNLVGERNALPSTNVSVSQPNLAGERISQSNLVGERNALPSAGVNQLLQGCFAVGSSTYNEPKGQSFSNSLSQYGQIVENGIRRIPHYYQTVFVDHYVIMPNHIHLLIRIENSENGSDSQNLLNRSSTPSLSTIINQLKGAITKQIGKSIWQRSFYDHIIRDDQDYERIWQYIEWNPLKWQEDQYFPAE